MIMDVNPEASNELTPSQRYGLALSGILTMANDYRIDTLYPEDVNENGKETTIKVLKRDWGIETVDDLYSSLSWLGENGGNNGEFMEMLHFLEVMDMASRKRFIESKKTDPKQFARLTMVDRYLFRFQNKGIMAWDYGRYVMLCRWGAYLGLIRDSEAWERINQVAKTVQPVFEDWYEYGLNYITGYSFGFSTLSSERPNAMIANIKRLLSGENAPWAIDWNIDLSVGYVSN
jgi:hypothetical protein